MKKMSILIIIWIFIIPFHLSAQEKDTIIWMENDFPPIWILEGPHKGTGGADLIQNLLIKKLSGYNHQKLQVNVIRFHMMMKERYNVCDCAAFKTADREKYMYFTAVPSSFILANGIITKKNSRHLFGSSPKISLADTLKNQKLILGITKDRKFGGRIDQILENHKGGNIYGRTGSDLTKGLVSMLLGDRVNYILGYDWELQYLVKQFWSSEKADELIFLPIQETKPYLSSYTACSKTDWGRKVIDKIDKILTEEIPKKQYRGIWEQWMSNKELYRKLYNEVYLKQIQK